MTTEAANLLLDMYRKIKYESCIVSITLYCVHHQRKERREMSILAYTITHQKLGTQPLSASFPRQWNHVIQLPYFYWLF